MGDVLETSPICDQQGHTTVEHQKEHVLNDRSNTPPYRHELLTIFHLQRLSCRLDPSISPDKNTTFINKLNSINSNIIFSTFQFLQAHLNKHFRFFQKVLISNFF